jgi:hypothetical protein
MTTKVDTTIEVDVPVSTAYNQWTQFESFPQFMSGVKEVQQLGDRRLHWVAEIAGVNREWDAEIVDQEPDSKVAWVATEGATNAGAVYFQSLGLGRTLVRLNLEYEPEGVVEKAGDALNIVEKRAEGDLERFKDFIESRRHETGAWRGTVEGGAVGTPGADDASPTRGDSGKAGVSGKAVAAGVAAAAAGAAVAGTAAKKAHSSESRDPGDDVERPITDLPPTADPVLGYDPLEPRDEVADPFPSAMGEVPTDDERS